MATKADELKLKVEDEKERGEKSGKFRSGAGQALHTLIMATINGKKTELETNIKKIKTFFDNRDNCAALLELSSNQCSHLQDCLHLPFERIKDLSFALDVSLSLLERLKFEYEY